MFRVDIGKTSGNKLSALAMYSLGELCGDTYMQTNVYGEVSEAKVLIVRNVIERCLLLTIEDCSAL